MSNVVAVGGTEAMAAGDALRLSACAACDANMLPAAAHEIAKAVAAEARKVFSSKFPECACVVHGS